MQELDFPSWNFTIGDPTFMGWFTFFAYVLSAFLAFIVFRNSSSLFSTKTIKIQKAFWLFTAVLMFLLAINKQLDLQSYLTAIGRYYAKKDGWYNDRRAYQHMLIEAIIYASFSFAIFLVWYLRATFIDNALAILGICFLLAFIAIRASSFHDMDLLIQSTVSDFKLNWILELSGIFMITLASILILRRLLVVGKEKTKYPVY